MPAVRLSVDRTRDINVRSHHFLTRIRIKNTTTATLLIPMARETTLCPMTRILMPVAISSMVKYWTWTPMPYVAAAVHRPANVVIKIYAFSSDRADQTLAYVHTQVTIIR